MPDDPATTIVDNGDYRWTSPVVMGDPATIVTPGYSKPGYKWMGWEIRKADGSTLVKYDGGATVNYNELARLLGLDSKTALDTPVTVYAVWAEWLPSPSSSTPRTPMARSSSSTSTTPPMTRRSTTAAPTRFPTPS